MARISSGATDKIVTPDEERFLNTTAEDASVIEPLAIFPVFFFIFKNVIPSVDRNCNDCC